MLIDSTCYTQAANYILKPGEQYNGTWHLEGMVSAIRRLYFNIIDLFTAS